MASSLLRAYRGWMNRVRTPKRMAIVLASTTVLTVGAMGAAGAIDGDDDAQERPIPAGDYELVLSGSNRPRGEISIHVGRTGLVLDRFSLDGRPSGPSGLVLQLPVRVQSVTIVGDEEARRSISRIDLRPRLLGDATGSRASGFALWASRQGAARVFFLDTGAFMEPGGFWTRGASRTQVVIDANGSAVPPTLVVRAGPVPTTAELISGDWAESLRLSPGEQRHVRLPALHGAEAWLVEVVTSEGFRPAWHDPASRDMRDLGVWIAPD